MIAEKLNRIMKQKRITKVTLAEYLGMSPQSLTNKFFRDSFSVPDLVKILDFLDCRLVIESLPDTKIVFEPDK